MPFLIVYEVDGPFEARTGLCRSIDMSCVCSRLSYVPIDMSCVCSRLSFASVDMSCVCSRLLFDAQRQTERLAECSVPIPPWVGIAISAFSMAVRLSDLVGSFRACAFLYGDPDGERRDGGTRRTEGHGEQSRRRGGRAFLRDRIGFAMFSAGSTLGLKCGSRTAAAPDCAKEPLALWTLLIWVVMWVRFTQRRTLGYNVD